jgi:sugar phosphate isomerase/epimerase
MNRRTFLGAAAAAGAHAAAPPRSRMGLATTSFMTARRPRETFDFLEYAHSLGAGGIQASLSSLEPAYLKKLRDRAAQLDLYIEVMAGLPKGGDASAFERTVAAAKEAGALAVRAACLGGRRYETFSNLPAWEMFVTESRASIDLALRVLEKHRMRLALENHKDWTLDELLALIKDRSSPYFGVCLDTGNNIAMLDDPMAVVDALAPFAFSTHIKDMAVEAYPDGFRLSEVPLGEGMLDMKRIVATVRRAQPQTRFSLEMITRNPLEIPCLTDSYWVTFSQRHALFLARSLRMVRDHKFGQALPRVSHLPRPAQLRLEVDNVKQSLNYAREQLGL